MYEPCAYSFIEDDLFSFICATAFNPALTGVERVELMVSTALKTPNPAPATLSELAMLLVVFATSLIPCVTCCLTPKLKPAFKEVWTSSLYSSASPDSMFKFLPANIARLLSATMFEAKMFVWLFEEMAISSATMLLAF